MTPANVDKLAMMSWSREHVGCNLREEISVKVGVHQGSSLSPLLFITVQKPSPKSFILNHWRNCSWVRPLCRRPGHHLWITGGTATEAGPLKFSMEGKGLRVSMLHGRETMGEDRGGGYPWGSTPLIIPAQFFPFYSGSPFYLYFFRNSPPKIKIFPQAHLTPAPCPFFIKSPPNPQPLTPVLHVLPYETCAPPADWWYVHVKCSDS